MDPKNSTHNILVDGKLLPVVKMFGKGGQEVGNPLHAFVVIVFDAKAKEFKAHETRPGELWPVRRSPNDTESPCPSTH